ncbi:MAG: hypothetical protein LBK25_00370 [Treponema sp.]|nr:hypothetical protein [Treponema sp.]
MHASGTYVVFEGSKRRRLRVSDNTRRMFNDFPRGVIRQANLGGNFK